MFQLFVKYTFLRAAILIALSIVKIIKKINSKTSINWIKESFIGTHINISISVFKIMKNMINVSK
jgi:hypothetical protein